MNKIWMLALSTLCACQNGIKTQQTKATHKDITESVYASINVKPETVYFPQPKKSGIIEKIFVSEGDLVTEGQILFQISSSTEVNSKLNDAEISLEQARLNYTGKDNLLKNISEELSASKYQLDLDSTNYKKLEKLWQKNIGAKVDLDRARLAYESSLSKYEILKNKFAQTKNELKTNYERALNAVKSDKTLLDDFVVYSKINGRVYEVFKEVGEWIHSQEKFAEIGSAEEFIIEMDIDEVDISKINLNDTVLINLEAYPSQTFTAEINFITSKKNERTQTFRAESRFIESPNKIFNGLAGEANIIVSRKTNALIIPSDYLLSSNKVLTKEGAITISTGMKNMDIVEIISGIDTSIVLIKPE
jgi:multidrug efflux pump subunit AcrA (membrane-fusion protein)